MPAYSFKCEKCEAIDLQVFSMKEYQEKVKNDFLETNEVCPYCKASNKFKRVYTKVNLGPNIYKLDPASNQYFGRGKSVSEMADIYAGISEPY